NHINAISSLQGEEFSDDPEVIAEAIDGFMFNPDPANEASSFESIQIYIPSVDIVNLNQNPIICVNYGDEDEENPNETITGYRLKDDGTLEKIIVSEAMAAQQLVWVVGVNERPNVPCPPPTTTGSGGT